MQGSIAITAMAKKQFDEVITDFLKEDDKTSVPSKPKAGISQNKYIKSPASSLNTSRNSINQKYKKKQWKSQMNLKYPNGMPDH